jgi:hypothetical protein
MAALVGVLWIPWTAQLTVVMWRIEGSSPVLTIIQLIGGTLTAGAVAQPNEAPHAGYFDVLSG